MTPDEIRDARAHFAHLVETCEQGAREMREQAEAIGVEQGSIILIPTAVALERDAKLARSAVEGLDALERERKATNEAPMPQRFTCPCGRKYEVGTIPDVFGDRVVRSLYACLVEGPVLPLLNVQVTGTKASR